MKLYSNLPQVPIGKMCFKVVIDLSNFFTEILAIMIKKVIGAGYIH